MRPRATAGIDRARRVTDGVMHGRSRIPWRCAGATAAPPVVRATEEGFWDGSCAAWPHASPTTPVGEGRWRVRNVALGPRGSRAEVLCEQWYRPLEYAETDEYLVMYEGLPRWVCRP